MPSISFGGLGNGIDFGEIVSQLVAIQRLPITRLSDQQKAVQGKLDDYSTLGTKLLALQSAANTLRTGTSFDQSTVSVSDETMLTASASSTAVPGTYTIKVTQLAAGHQITNKAAKAVASTTTDIVSGASATFTFKVGSGANQTVTLSADATLDALKTAINDLGAGVSASVLNTGTEAAPAYRLVLTSTATGASNAVTILSDTTTLDFLNTSGTGGTDTLQAAQDAVVILGNPNLNPVTLQRSSNTITDAVSGLTLNLKNFSATGTVTLSVSRDTGAVTDNIKELVKAYNDVVDFVNTRTTYDVETHKGGPFVGESTARTVLSQIRQALSSTVSGVTTYTVASQVGFKTERDGKIALDESVLGQALSSNYTAVKNLFIGQTSTTGVAERLYDAVDVLDDIEFGTLTLRKEGLTSQIDTLADVIARKEDALAAYEERLRRQYASLDALLRQLETQGEVLKSRL